ncbi:MAG TPA: hypothetical protein VGL91_06650 [Acidobacteriota bacterium]|jgi:hypothetical protein
MNEAACYIHEATERSYVLTMGQQRIVSESIAVTKNPVEKSVQLKKKEKKEQKKKEKWPVENWKAAKSAPSHFPTGPTTGGCLLIIKKVSTMS